MPSEKKSSGPQKEMLVAVAIITQIVVRSLEKSCTAETAHVLWEVQIQGHPVLIEKTALRFYSVRLSAGRLPGPAKLLLPSADTGDLA